MSVPKGYKFGKRKLPPPFSEEHRRHISESHKGKMPKNIVAGWNKGLKGIIKLWPNGRVFTEEWKKNISEGHKGLKQSKEANEKRRTKAKIRLKVLGYINSSETRKKISEGKRGVPRLDIRGENCHFWRGGINPIKKAIRKCLEYRIWRTHCFQRDNYKCVLCGENGGGQLNVDHIMPFSMILQIYKIKTIEDAKKCEQLWDIRNGRTLCIPCHQKTDTYGNKLFKKQSVGSVD